MNRKIGVVAMFLALAFVGSYLALAQNPQGQQPQQPMSFFVASAGLGKGGDLGGLAGADAHCQALAQAAGSTGKTWHAYLSTQAAGSQVAVNARDRIGSGPWYNAKGARIAKDVGDLHGDTLDQARLGNNMGKQTDITEKGQINNGVGDQPNTHDMLTGSQPAIQGLADSLQLYSVYKGAGLVHLLGTVRVKGPVLLSNPFYELPEQALSRTAQPHDVTRKIRKLYPTASF